MEQVKEEVRSGCVGAAVEAIVQDARYAARSIRSSPTHALWVIGSLAAGMAVTIAALAVLNAVLFLPFAGITRQQELVRIWMSENCGRPGCWSRIPVQAHYDKIRDTLSSVDDVAAYAVVDLVVGLPEARPVRGCLASANYFDVLGARPVLGRTFDALDARNRAHVAVIGHSFWIREFHGDPGVIGRSIRLGDGFAEIIGVAPPQFLGIDRPRAPGPRRMTTGRPPDLWLPMWLADRLLQWQATGHPGSDSGFELVGRLKRGVQLRQVEAEATAAAAALAASDGRELPGARAEVHPVRRVSPRSWPLGIGVLMPIPLLVLAIACLNAANLVLARGSHRHREFAIRLAIGAGRWRIVRQQLLEGALLVLLATAVALPLSWWALSLVATPFEGPVPFDLTVMGLTVMTAMATTVAFALGPALRAGSEQPGRALAPVGARVDAVPQQTRVRRALLALQVALSLAVLSIGSQLVFTVRAQDVSAGTPAHRLLIARFDLELLKLDPAEVEAVYDRLLAGVSLMPEVEAVGLARHGAVWTFGQGRLASLLVWRPTDGPQDGETTIGGFIGGDLLNAIGLRVLQGRGFTDADRRLRPQVAIVNETAAAALGGSAVGQTIRVAPPGGQLHSSVELRIVGVVESVSEPRLEQGGPPPAKVYLPSPIEPEPALALYIRSRGDAALVGQPLRELVSRVSPRVPILELGTLADFNHRSYSTQLWLARSAVVLGLVGLLLATAGVYGVSSYLVGMRRRELAVRVALGATPRSILLMVLRQTLGVAGLGLVAGSAVSLAIGRWIQSEYHGIVGVHAVAFAGAIALFMTATFVASAVPARRAARVNPVEHLRDA